MCTVSCSNIAQDKEAVDIEIEQKKLAARLTKSKAALRNGLSLREMFDLREYVVHVLLC